MKIPKSWEEIPLNRFKQYLETCEEKPFELTKESTEEDINRYNTEAVDIIRKKTCALLGCDLEAVKNLTAEEQAEVKRLMAKPLPTRLQLHFKYKGQNYRPYIESKKNRNLNKIYDLTKQIEIDTKKFNGGKYSAFKNVQTRGTTNYLHQLLFLSCEPIKYGFKKRFPFVGWRYQDLTEKEIEQRIEEFKDIPLGIAYPTLVFFLMKSRELRSLLEHYLSNQMTAMTQEVLELQEDLEKDMDG